MTTVKWCPSSPRPPLSALVSSEHMLPFDFAW